MENEAKNRILIVEDKEENLELLQAVIESSGYKTVLARNGLEALEQLKKVPIDLIISDILMPKMDGFQLCRECKKDEKFWKIPFILSTASYADKQDEEFALRLGADRVIIKPIAQKELLKIVEEVLKKGKRGAVSIAKKTAVEETVYLKEYSERLIQKLEDKHEQLQKELAERKKTEEELRSSEGKFRAIFDNANDGMLLADVATKKFYTGNNTACQMLGYSLEEIKNLSVTDIHPKEDLPHVMGEFEKQARREIAVTKDIPVKRKDGTVFYADVNTSSVTLDERTYLLGIFRDVTERKRAEEKIKVFSDAIASAFDCFIVTDMKGNITYVNESACAIFGYTSEEFLKLNIAKLLEADPEVVKKITQEIAEKGRWSGEVTNVKKNKEEFFSLLSAFIIKDDEGNPKGMMGILRDITERKKQEEQIRHAAGEWRMTFDSITDLVSIIDREFRLVRVNSAFAHAFGMNPKEVIGKTCYELVREAGESWFTYPHKKTVETKKPNTAEFFEPHLKIYLEVSTSPIFDDKGEVVATVHTAKDITQRREIEKSQRLSELGKLVADMAHEVNNPLMIISGNAQLSLMEGTKEEEIKNNLRVIFEESHRAKDIIQRLLKFSRPSKGETQEVDINTSIEKIVAMVQHPFMLANVEIKRKYLENPPLIAIDEQQMQEVFMNLVNNAKEAMPNGGTITITTSLEGDFLRMDFKDTGCGMSEEVKKKLFEPFFTTKEKGTGLGLPVCYGIVKAHNGEFRFESELNKGTIATVLLPLRGG